MEIKAIASYLRLSYIRDHHDLLIDEANHLDLSHREMLKMALEREAEKRKQSGTNKRIIRAKFPIKHYLEDFDRGKYDPKIRNKFKELETMKFIENKENIILIGTSGCGKTHYATALGIQACQIGKTVHFSSVPNLLLEIKEAMSLNQVTIYKRNFEKYDLVILDELGYISFDKGGCEVLFNLLSNRNNKGSIIITTNLVFEKWVEIFKDPMLTGAIVDRLAHKAHIIDMSLDVSYRIEDTMNWIKAGKK